ncbi:MAG: multicopper oxidase domain-containing protein [Thermomicrobiales bacterium]
MLTGFYWMDIGIALILAALWGIAALLAGRLPAARTPGRLRFTAWAALLVLVAAQLFGLLRLGTVLGMWAIDREFAEDRLLGGLPIFLPAALITLVWSMPLLRRLARAAGANDRAALDAALRSDAATPGLIVPIQITALGTIIAAWLALSPPSPPYLETTVLLVAVLVIVATVRWIFQGRRALSLREGTARPSPRFAVRLMRATSVAAVLVLALGGWFVWSMQASRLPDHMSMMAADNVDWGGGPGGEHNHGPNAISVTELTGPRTGEPDHRYTLTAKQATVELNSGTTIDAWTFNGQAPGPELRVRQGDLIEVILVNDDIADGVSIHWHGVDVPNAEDGVAGVTQDAVQPGQTYTYRFVAEDAGTYWYHSHQQSSKQVKKGLFGALVVLPDGYDDSAVEEIIVVAHSWPDGDNQYGSVATSFGIADTVDRRAVAPGTSVRLRLINSDSTPMRLTLAGTPFQVAAIDGTDLNQPTDLDGESLQLAGGGRYDLTFTMPEMPVALSRDGNDPTLLLSADGAGDVPEANADSTFVPSDYGSPAETPFDASSEFDREFEMRLGNRVGFYDGQPNLLFTINGEVFPDTPMFMVREGDLVKVTIINHSYMDHPMHLHGHHLLVLSRNGDATTGSPWWVDTLNVAPGETYELAFRADNPGVWMDHCHNLDHAAIGMTMHLAYDGVTSPFEIGHDTPNQPE